MADEIRRRRRRMATNSLREVLEVEIVKKVSSVWFMVIFLNIDNLLRVYVYSLVMIMNVL